MLRGERLVARLGDVQPEGRHGERDEQARRDETRQDRPPEHAVDDCRPEARAGGLGAQVRQEGDPAAVDAGAEQLEHGRQDGDGARDRAGDDGNRPARDAVEDVGADHVLAGHGDRDGAAGDEHRAAGGAGGARERLVRGRAALPLLAGADDVEERVVDADGHADQEHDRLDGVVEREGLADRAEQAEGGRDRRQREQHRHERGDDRAEGKEEHEQRHGHGQELRAVQVAVDDGVACVARRDVAGLPDRHLRMSLAGGEHYRPERVDGERPPHRADDEDAVVVARAPEGDLAAELSPHRGDDVESGALERVVLRPQRVAVDEAVLARRRPGQVLVHERVAARRLADGAVSERVGSGRDARPDRDDDEGDPGGDRAPRVPRAPAPDPGDRPHSPGPSLGRSGRVA